MVYGNNIFEIVLIVSVIWIVVIILIVDHIHRLKSADVNERENKIQVVLAVCAKGTLVKHSDNFMNLVYTDNQNYVLTEHKILKTFKIDSEIRGNELLISL